MFPLFVFVVFSPSRSCTAPAAEAGGARGTRPCRELDSNPGFPENGARCDMTPGRGSVRSNLDCSESATGPAEKQEIHQLGSITDTNSILTAYTLPEKYKPIHAECPYFIRI